MEMDEAQLDILKTDFNVYMDHLHEKMYALRNEETVKIMERMNVKTEIILMEMDEIRIENLKNDMLVLVELLFQKILDLNI